MTDPADEFVVASVSFVMGMVVAMLLLTWMGASR